jgi:hypothetical protein
MKGGKMDGERKGKESWYRQHGKRGYTPNASSFHQLSHSVGRAPTVSSQPLQHHPTLTERFYLCPRDGNVGPLGSRKVKDEYRE